MTTVACREPGLSLSVVRISHPAGVAVVAHRHAEGQLLLLEQGTLKISCDSGWWLAPPGQAVWVPAGVDHQASYSEASLVLRLLLESPQLSGLPPYCLVFGVSPLLWALAREGLEFGRAGRVGGDEPLIAALVLHQLRQPPRAPLYFLPGGHSRRLQAVITRLQRAPASRETLEQLAEFAHCSSRTQARLFETETGMGFTRWRDQLHLICALDGLARGWSVTRTALELGYLSPSSFSTMFSRVAGVAPSRFAASEKALEAQALRQ